MSTIQLTLHFDVLYNVMKKESAPCLWSKLESLYISKPLIKKLFLKKQLYSLNMIDGS